MLCVVRNFELHCWCVMGIELRIEVAFGTGFLIFLLPVMGRLHICLLTHIVDALWDLRLM